MKALLLSNETEILLCNINAFLSCDHVTAVCIDLAKKLKENLSVISSFFKMDSNWSIPYKDWAVHCTRDEWASLEKFLAQKFIFHFIWVNFSCRMYFWVKFTWIIEFSILVYACFFFFTKLQTTSKQYIKCTIWTFYSYLGVSIQHLLCNMKFAWRYVDENPAIGCYYYIHNHYEFVFKWGPHLQTEL